MLAAALWLLTPGLAPAQTVPEAPAQLFVEAVEGDAVTLRWDAPANAAPDAYVLEGGFAPGDVAGSLSVGSEATTTQLALPPGVYFVRLHAIALGVRSAPSNEVQVRVGDLAPPSPPEAFAGVAVDHGAAVTWRQPSDGGGTPDTMLLDVTGPVNGSFPISATGSFRVDGVPDGVYTLRLRARNAAGTSAAAPAVTLTLPGWWLVAP